MDLKQESEGGVVIVTPVGRLDVASAKSVEGSLLEIVNSGKTKVVLDLSELDYLSSAGLRTLLVVGKRAESALGKVVLCSVRPGVREVLAVGGFDRIFAIHPDRAAAVAAL
ncbi:MAG: STAS domain-containing protein [Alphaproteobacteria bacterium]